MLRQVTFYRREAGVGNDMLHPAGIFHSCFFIDAQMHQNPGNHLMPLINLLRDLPALFRQSDLAALIHNDAPAGLQFSQSDADRSLGQLHLLRYIHGADAVLLTYWGSTMNELPAEGTSWSTNLPAGLLACFGACDAKGSSPVRMPEPEEWNKTQAENETEKP